MPDIGDDQNNEAKHLKKEEYVKVAVEIVETVAECRKMWSRRFKKILIIF